MNMILPWIITIGFYGFYLLALVDLWITIRRVTWEDH